MKNNNRDLTLFFSSQVPQIFIIFIILLGFFFFNQSVFAVPASTTDPAAASVSNALPTEVSVSEISIDPVVLENISFEELKEVFRKNPKNIPIRKKLLEELFKRALDHSNNLEERSKNFQEASEIDSDNYKIQYLWGNACFEKKMWEDAATHFEISANLNPENLDGLMKLGLCYLQSLKLEEAVSTYEKAKKISPKNFYILFYLAKASFENKDYDNALENFEDALPLAPNEQDAATVQEYLNKAKEQLASTGNSTRDETQKFIVYYAGDSQKDIGQLTSEILEQVYDQVSDDLQFKPDTKVNVVFYKTDDFYSVNQANKWVGALTQGIKILVPLQQGYSDPTNVKGVFAHELTHVLINLKTNQNCPTWIHEGTAVHSELQAVYGDSNILYPAYASLLEKIKDQKAFPPLQTLNLSPSRSDSNGEIMQGYLESYLAIRFLYERWGTQGMDELLTSLGKGSNVDNAVEEATGRNLAQFQTELFDWIPSL
ncbi:MAG: tetratricopeptide repeat protein [Candidatus Riflebacteria bacterium]|nr:tetratricopeptide repeat protein [Candidatus Riflebacteria bacterium]